MRAASLPLACFLQSIDSDDTDAEERGRCGLHKSVLIVDDEQLLARTLSTVLREAGYRTVVAGSAEEAERYDDRWHRGRQASASYPRHRDRPSPPGRSRSRSARRSCESRSRPCNAPSRREDRDDAARLRRSLLLGSRMRARRES